MYKFVHINLMNNELASRGDESVSHKSFESKHKNLSVDRTQVLQFALYDDMQKRKREPKEGKKRKKEVPHRARKNWPVGKKRSIACESLKIRVRRFSFGNVAVAVRSFSSIARNLC